MKPKILVFAGSTREGSFNKRIAKMALAAAEQAGANATYVDLRDYEMPFYDGDLEEKEGMPEKAKALKRLMMDAEGLIIASPEYNSGPSAVLKNVIDWCSRQESEDEGSLVAFQGKVCGLISASPGGFGGMRGLVHVRMILGNIGVTVLPKQYCVAGVHEKFDEAGECSDEGTKKGVAAVAVNLVEVLKKLK